MEAAADKRHIVLFPWLAFGHMLPFLELSKSLARRGHLVSFISTPRNIQRLPRPPPQISHLIHFIPFSLPRVDGVAESVEATFDLPSAADIHHLMKAMDGLEQPFRAFVSEVSPKPDWIIQDFMQHWIPRAAAEAGVPLVLFAACAASALTFFGTLSGDSSRREPEQFMVPPPWVPFPSKVAYRRHEILKMVEAAGRPDHSGVGVPSRMRMAIEGCSVAAVRSCGELEGDWLPVLEGVYQKKVIPVGVLLSYPVNERAEAEILHWLGRKSAGSVVYVALGSEVTISVELVHELAHRLEEARLPFLWALRSNEEILPEGFEERTAGYGKVATEWVPQLAVLAHGAVGGFLTHCGWGSIVESLHFGHPLVMLPIASDQGLNARMLEEKGLVVEVERKEDGSFTRDEVKEALSSIMSEEGEGYRKRAREMKEALPDQEGQEKYVDDFVQHLLSHRKLTSMNSTSRNGNLI